MPNIHYTRCSQYNLFSALSRSCFLHRADLVLCTLSEIHTTNTHHMRVLSRIDKSMGLFCKRPLYKRQYSAQETYNLIDPTDCSHPIAVSMPPLSCFYPTVHISFFISFMWLPTSSSFYLAVFICTGRGST